MTKIESDELRVGWIVSQPDISDSDLFPDVPAHHLQVFPWAPSRVAFCSDHTQEHAVHASPRLFGGFVVSGMSLAELESLYNLRALQLLDREGRLDSPSIVIVRPGATPDAFPRFGQRLRAGWPFRSVLFVADAATVELLRHEGLAAIERSEARRAGLMQLLARNAGAFPDTLADQVLAVQIQPPWPYVGSHTVFANQTDSLLDRNWFVLRIIVEPEAGPGPTIRRLMKSRIAEANVDATAHLDTIACAGATPHGCSAPSADELYRVTARTLMRTVIADELAARLAARADIVVVNYALYAGFALKACPAAKLVLETHDDITRSSVTRSLVLADHPVFPTRTSVKRHLRMERLIWSLADVCIALSLSELIKIKRHAPTVYVLPRPYARPAREAGSAARWDICIVMNPHPFNIQGLDDFLQDVVDGNPSMAGLRIAIAGRINDSLESKWKERLPNTHWLGYVKDIDSLRDVSRLSVCPERHGTGVAIKTLTAIVAGHPLVATSTALRGLPGAIVGLIPPADGPAEMQRQIMHLLDNEDLLRERRDNVERARDLLWPAQSHDRALSLALGAGDDKSAIRAELLATIEAGAPPPDHLRPSAEPHAIRFGEDGNDAPYLGRGWLHDEPGGRWSDGGSATVRIPAGWLSSPGVLVLSFMPDFRGPDVTLKQDGRPLSCVSRQADRMEFEVDLTDKLRGETCVFEISCASEFCPRDAGISNDERVLGVHVRSIEFLARRPKAPAAGWFAGLSSGAGRVLSRIARP